MRRLVGYSGLVVGVVAVVMSVYHVYARLTTAAPDSLVLRIITLAFSLVLAFLLFPGRRGATRDRIPWTDLALAAVSLASVGYLFANYNYVTMRMPTADPLGAAWPRVGTDVDVHGHSGARIAPFTRAPPPPPAPRQRHQPHASAGGAPGSTTRVWALGGHRRSTPYH